MKKTIKMLPVILLVAIVMFSCKKDDDGPVMPKAKFSSVKYSPNKLEAKEKVAFSSKNAVTNPNNASVTFKISKVKKDNKDFANPKSGGLIIDAKGRISAPKDHKLEPGTYVLTVTATTKKDKKKKKDKAITKMTTFTVVITKAATAKLVAISYSPNKLTGKQKTAMKGKGATVNPKDASVSFKITQVKKDKKVFTNPKSGGFMIDAMGKVSLKKDYKLGKGTYELVITATDRGDKKNKKKTKLMVTIG